MCPTTPEKNETESRQIKLNPHMTVGQEIEPAPHRWKASALTTATNPAPLNDHKNAMIRMLKY